jgi:hypothetical protein
MAEINKTERGTVDRGLGRVVRFVSPRRGGPQGVVIHGQKVSLLEEDVPIVGKVKKDAKVRTAQTAKRPQSDPVSPRSVPAATVSPPPLVQAEPPYSPPPLVQAEPPYSQPPLIQAEPPPRLFLVPWPQSNRINDDERGIANETRALTRSAKKNTGQRLWPEGANLSSGGWSARLLEAPSEIVAPDPKSAGEFANPDIPQELRQAGLAKIRPDFGFWLERTLAPLVSNFLLNLGLKRNDRSELIAAGMIFRGQSKKDEGNVLQNGSQMNAFRHAFGQALITKKFDRKDAELVGFAHEDLPTIDTTRRYFSNPATPSNALFEADTVADQLNNEIGRRVAEKLSGKVSNRDLAEAILREFKDTGLYMGSFRGRGEVTISRQRLPEAQFQLCIGLLKSFDEEGHPSQ